ncbi:hypothetical protein [Collimonas antrihumi]|uniref:hypothetical protein n=1 Tax=Collimonas antrihumi TaxID=1940615 RepID=UPI001B8B64F6|nr:hypothetical protein [Collimonas antrihumi]
MSGTQISPDGDDFMTPEWMQQRAHDLAVMNAHGLMRNSAMLDDATLAEWLDGAHIQGSADYFDGFAVLFGFDRHGQDFVVIKSDDEGGLHFALIAERSHHAKA